MMEKAVFKVEILADFNFYVCFLAALLLSGVPLYADENKIASSASKLSSLFFIIMIKKLKKLFIFLPRCDTMYIIYCL